MATLEGVDLGTVTSESSTKNSSLFNQPLPFTDSDGALLMDLFGVTRTITVDGVKTGTVAALRTFVSNIEALQNGEQSSLTFVSSWTNSNKEVLIQDFTHTKVGADESQITYTLTLMEGSVI